MKRLDSIFDLRYGHSLELNALSQVEAPAGVNFVSRAMGNNGVTGRVLVDQAPASAGEISVALSGNGVLSSFVQPEPFVTGFHVMILTAKDPNMTTAEKLWWCRCIWQNRYRFSYGRQANRTLGSLLVPDECPDWALSLEIPSNDGLAKATSSRLELPDPADWREFRVGDLFGVKSGAYVRASLKKLGSTPEVTSSAGNNGVRRKINLEPNFPGGVLSVARNGAVGKAFYQPVPFFGTDDVRVWIAQKGPLNAEEALFLCAVIELEQFRYSYGRKWSVPQMENALIRLPKGSDGYPDWNWMSQYIRGLPFSAALVSASAAVTEQRVG